MNKIRLFLFFLVVGLVTTAIGAGAGVGLVIILALGWPWMLGVVICYAVVLAVLLVMVHCRSDDGCD